MRNIIESYARNPTAPSDTHSHMFFNANKYVPGEKPLHQFFEYIVRRPIERESWNIPPEKKYISLRVNLKIKSLLSKISLSNAIINQNIIIGGYLVSDDGQDEFYDIYADIFVFSVLLPGTRKNS